MKKVALFFAIIWVFSQSLSAQVNDINTFFDQTDQFLKSYVKNGQVAYEKLNNNAQLNQLTDFVGRASLSNLDAATTQAFYINAYNLLVIKGAVANYPLTSVLNVNGFFDSKKYKVAGQSLTLNQIEKDRLLKTYKDSRFHFVLVCGAVGCPPITNFAYRPEKLESQLQSQTRKALNNAQFIRVDAANQSVSLSQIFEWYSSDFGGSKTSALAFINKYRSQKIPADYKIQFYTYDWSLNEQPSGNGSIDVEEVTDFDASEGNNAARYVVSAAIPKRTTETKIFNNLYTQQTGDGETLIDRSTFFTSWLSFVYGVSDRFNAGFDLRYRRVSNDRASASPFSVLGNPQGAVTRQGITSIGPKIRWAPTAKLPNFSIQSAFWFPVGENLQGNGQLPFIDWDGATWWTQFFNDFPLGNNFSLFTEIDFMIEDIGSRAEGDINRISTPATVILSYFPNPQTTFYFLNGVSPYWQQDFDYFAQSGLGFKYQFTRKFEVELLYTAFTNEFLQENNGRASTFNFGLRFNR
ncbi:MAG: DUF547 domain-containing protein [Bacteroidota bacterium]